MDVRLVVIDNTTRSVAVDVCDGWVIEPPGNLGYGASVNLAIKALPHEPFWLVANHDVVFAPGDLHRLAGATESGDWGWVGIHDWRVFGLTAETVSRVGLFDEHFHPAYCEDADYERRCTLAGIRWGFIDGGTSHVGSIVLRDHGADNARSYPANVAYYCQGSIVLRDHGADNARSYPANVAWYCAKWGVPGVRAPGGYTTPFDRGGDLAEGTEPTLPRLRANAWR